MSPINNTKQIKYLNKSKPFIESGLDEYSLKKPQNQTSALVIDDNIINQRVAFIYLKEAGFQKIDLALTGYEASEFFKQRYYSLIVLDIDLPDISGFEICKNIKQSSRNNDTPIIIATSHRENQIKNRCFALGAIAVLTKPLNFNLLIKKLPIELTKENKRIKQNCLNYEMRGYEKKSS